MDPGPIFVHSSFRTVSTQIWACLRRPDRTVAYYEIFNEILATLTRTQAASLSPGCWHSKHPASAPYFMEFLPLIRETGGVEGFDPAMSYAGFVPADGPRGRPDEAQIGYVGALIAAARAVGRVPVLTATRSLGRVTGLASAFPGLHVLLYRNLFHQWCSYTEQAHVGNSNFLEKTDAVIRLNQHDPILQWIEQAFPADAATMENPNTFYRFFFLHLHLYIQSAGAADLVIDVVRAATDAAHRRDIAAAFAPHGLDLDLSGLKPSLGFSLCALPPRRVFEERIRIFGNQLLDRAPDARGRALGAMAIDDLIEDHARHEFQCAGLRSVLVKSNDARDGLVADLAAARHRHAEIEAARDHLRGECEHHFAEAGRLAGQVTEHAGEAARLSLQLAEQTARNEALSAELTGMARERDETAARCDLLRTDLEAAAQSLETAARTEAALQRVQAGNLETIAALRGELAGALAGHDHRQALAIRRIEMLQRTLRETLEEYAAFRRDRARRDMAASRAWRPLRALRRLFGGAPDRAPIPVPAARAAPEPASVR